MSNPSLVHLSYASQATSLPEALGRDLNEILDTARLYNPQHQITGVLYFGQGHFFQYIEGPKDAMEQLYQAILHDPRHCNVQLLDRGVVQQRRFGRWSMKYVMLNDALRRWLHERHFSTFDPYRLQGPLLEQFVAKLQHLHGELSSGEASVAVAPEPLQLLPRERVMAFAMAMLAALLLVLGFVWVRQHG